MYHYTLTRKKYFIFDAEHNPVLSHLNDHLFTRDVQIASLLIQDLNKIEASFSALKIELRQSFVYCMVSTFCNLKKHKNSCNCSECRDRDDSPESQLHFMYNLLENFFQGMDRAVHRWMSDEIKTSKLVDQYLGDGLLLELGDLGEPEEKPIGSANMETQKVGSIKTANKELYRQFLESTLENLKAYREYMRSLKKG